MNRAVFNNAKWIIGCKIVQSLLQFVVGILCARYLGPSNHGLLNYAASIVAFALPIMKLGLDATLVNELVNDPLREREIMGTALVMNITTSFLCIGSVTLFAYFMNMSESDVVLACFLYSLSILFAAVEMIQYWFQYKLMSKYSSLVMLGSYVILSAYKIFLLATGKSIHWFALSNSLDFGIIGFTLIAIYLKKGGGFSFSFKRVKSMFSASKHYILAALMLVIIQNTDHIMITSMVSDTENGYYSAAITCITMAQFVYVAIVDSFRPLILQNKKDTSEEYELNVSRLYSITLYIALAQCVLMTLLAGPIVTILYGSEYSASIPILRIAVWYYFFAVMGLVRNVWILAERKQKYLWIINLSGAVLNVILNGVLIPYYGASGAAFASFITQFFTNFILGFIMKPMRRNNKLVLKGLNPVFFFSQLKVILNTFLKKKAK